MVWLGGIKGCEGLVYNLARDENQIPDHRVVAILSLVASGSRHRLCELTRQMLARPSSWPSEVILRVAPDLFFSRIITVDDLLILLKRGVKADGHGSGYMTATLSKIVETLQPDLEIAIDLRNKLTDTIWQDRHKSVSEGRLRSRFDSFATALAKLCNRQLSVASGSLPEELTRASVIAFRFGNDGAVGRSDVFDDLKAHFDANQIWRRDAFWEELDVSADYPLRPRQIQEALSVGLVRWLDRC